MKNNFTSKVVIGCFYTLALVACESHEQKADDAFEQVKEEKSTINSSPIISNKIIEEPKKAELPKKNENSDEWSVFKSEMEKKILVNENKIKALKKTPDASTKLLRKITGLEDDNNNLRKQMDEYHEEMKMKWENFKLKINHDVNEINIELKDMVVNNKK
jgi:hypothetical protein